MYIIRFRSRGCTGWDIIESYGTQTQARSVTATLRMSGYEASDPVPAIILK
jgi:hypothetical protein